MHHHLRCLEVAVVLVFLVVPLIAAAPAEEVGALEEARGLLLEGHYLEAIRTLDRYAGELEDKRDAGELEDKRDAEELEDGRHAGGLEEKSGAEYGLTLALRGTVKVYSKDWRGAEEDCKAALEILDRVASEEDERLFELLQAKSDALHSLGIVCSEGARWGAVAAYHRRALELPFWTFL